MSCDVVDNREKGEHRLCKRSVLVFGAKHPHLTLIVSEHMSHVNGAKWSNKIISSSIVTRSP